MEQLLRAAPWMILAGLLFALFYILHRRFKANNVWESVVARYKDSVEGKLASEAVFVARYGSVENKSLFYKLDRLVLTSGMKKHFGWLNGEVLFIFLVLTAFAGFIEGTVFTGNGFIALFLAAAQFVLLYVIFKALAGRTYDQIEDSTSIFISILSNYAKGSSDIVTIMQNTKASIEGPIRELIERFILDAEKTGNVDIAFDYMKESIDNRQLQTIVLNLKNCMHYQANYEEVLAQMMGQIAASLSAREERKNILFSMKMTLIVISIASIFIVWVIGRGIGVDVKAILTGNMFGQGILFVTGLLYLFVAVKLFGTDK